MPSCGPGSSNGRTDRLTADSTATTITDGHNSRNSLDWSGTYQGVVPCADCEGIETRLTLKEDGSYLLETKYTGKSEKLFSKSGSFSWSEDGGKIVLLNYEEGPSNYQVGENVLIQLDQQGNSIAGELAEQYQLQKIDTGLFNTDEAKLIGGYWKLIELMGKPVEFPEDGKKEPHLLFRAEGRRLGGNGGCNNIVGTYEIKENNRISFSKMATTRMACPALGVEQQFLEVLQKVDGYNLVGDTLVLNRAKMAPLAKFQAVYM